MATLEDLRNELLTWIPDMPLLLAEKTIQRSWAEVRARRQWSFLLDDGILFTPGQISSGSFSVTQFSTTVQADADAIIALASLANPMITLREIRFAGGPIYEISSYDDITGVLTLSRAYRESTNATSEYSVYRCYYGPPILNDGSEGTDFLRWVAIYDPTNAYWFTKLAGTAQELNFYDPQRAFSGQPFGMYSITSSSNNVPRFEMHPHPLSERAYRAVFQRRGIDILAGAEFPPAIPEELILERALARGCNWAKTNIGVFPRLAKVGWGDSAIEHQRNYIDILKRAERDDEEACMQYWLLRDLPTQGFPYNGTFIATHDVDMFGFM
jgi:hypothetical protein